MAEWFSGTSFQYKPSIVTSNIPLHCTITGCESSLYIYIWMHTKCYTFTTFSFDFTDKTEEVRRLGMGRLLADVSQKMQAKIDRGVDDPLKILVHSTHDTSLAAICATLDVFDDK